MMASGIKNYDYKKKKKKNDDYSWALLVAHFCNPSYSRGSDQEGSRPAQATKLSPISKIPNTKIGEWSGSSGTALA
jgi:hypothetical protein